MMIKGYWCTKDITERFRCTSRTIYRWMEKPKHPFPKPRMLAAGSQNLWAIDDVEAWETQAANHQTNNSQAA
ncbi:hypothetical protein Sbal223_2649 [Shewanella baltica OS223]|uniref:helix-turn-helix transcriptional regulator n=1 Tax=Shewanella baltica TaxID=62322 RepID=UPI0001883EFC|nr:hypothetical protein [Shewanella baltica]ACK47139.1 hypothetical protein Sbal223_2649 [Shewanella baltica OS223]